MRQMVVVGVMLGGLACLPGGALSGKADEKVARAALPVDLASVPPDALAVVSLRPADLWGGEVGKAIRTRLGERTEAVDQVEAALGAPLADVERLTVVMTGAGHQMLAFVATGKKYDGKELAARVLPGAAEKRHNGKAYFVFEGRAVASLSDRTHVLGGEATVKEVLGAGKAAKEGGLAPALRAAAGKHSLVAGVNPAKLPNTDVLPPQAEPFKALIKARVGLLTADVGKGVDLRLSVRFADARDAAAGAKALEAGRAAAREALKGLIGRMSGEKAFADAAALLRRADGALGSVKLVTAKDTVSGAASVAVEPATVARLVVDAAAQARSASARALSANSLKQLGLGLHNYHSDHKSFPPAAVHDKNGKALLSWRVLILPYIDQKDLYDEFKLDEAWDSPHNKKLLAKMPKLFADPRGKGKANHTYYQAFVGAGAAFEGKRGLKVTDFTDGTSNTVMVAEAAAEVPWTKPVDMAYVPGKKLPAVGGTLFAAGFNALIGDGSVRFFSRAIKAKALEAYITRNGGEVIDRDE